MNGMVAVIVLACVRWAMVKFGARIGHAIFSDGDAQRVTEWIMAGGALVWSLEEKYHFRQLLMQALSSGPMSEQSAKALVKSPEVQTPSVMTPSHEVPTT